MLRSHSGNTYDGVRPTSELVKAKQEIFPSIAVVKDLELSYNLRILCPFSSNLYYISILHTEASLMVINCPVTKYFLAIRCKVQKQQAKR